MSSSNLKSNLSLTSLQSSASLKSSLLLTSSLLTTKSSLLTSSNLSSSLLSKISSSSVLTTTTKAGELKAVRSEAKDVTEKQTNVSLKRITTPNLSLDLEIKKLKVSTSNENNLLLDSRLNKSSSLANSALLSLKPSHNATSAPVLNKNLTIRPTLPQRTTNEKPFFHLDSITDETMHHDDSSSFIEDELALTQSIISLINTDDEQLNRKFNLDRRSLLPPKLNIPNEQLSFKDKPAILIHKSLLVNAVSAALLNQPDFKNPNDPTRALILTHAEQIILHNDAEFILKLALYTRKELNIRVVANFLLCLAAYKPECRPYIKRYFNQSIVLPTDWIEVAEQYQLFTDKRLNFGALPHALRKSMVEKFPDFDQYQLGKYNKEKSQKAKNSKIKDLKHVKSKLKEDDEKPDAKASPELVEDKYIKTVKSGLKINDRILFEVVAASEQCSNLKFDIISREESEEDKSMTFAMKKAKARMTKTQKRGGLQPEKKENNDQIAVRVNLDYTFRRITQKSFLKKAWTANRFSECVNNPKNFDFTHNHDSIFFFIDILSNEFQFGVIKNDKELNMSKYLHSKHNLPLNKLNCIRLSGVGVKLKDLQVKSKDVVASISTDETDESLIKQKSFTLKQLIRQLHISKPVENVMCLLGKKYPGSFEHFMQSKLPGVFDSERANKRMKLPVPETWETQLSLRGNKASVWEQLIDNKKLPYMAMLRNLRNMIVAGISDKHHQWVIRKLQDEGAVVNSKLFPFRFFTAYEVLGQLEEEFNKYMDWSQTAMDTEELGNKKGKKKPNKKDKKDKSKISDVNYDTDILKRYKTALDNALKIATSFNLSPIKGSTAIFLNLGQKMTQTSPAESGKSAKSLGKSVTSVADIAALLALMFNYGCEYSKLVIFGSGQVVTDIKLDSGTILDNMNILKSPNVPGTRLSDTNYQFPRSTLCNLLMDKKVFDNIVVLSQGIEEADVDLVSEFLRKYRTSINPRLLFVNVNLGVCSADQRVFNHANDVNISGFSDSILRFVAERSDQGQLTFIDKIDKAYDLPPLSNDKPNSQTTTTTSVATKSVEVERPRLKLYVSTPQIQWRSLRVFISSTFRDMHSERDMLTRTVFPMLRAKLAAHLINLYEIDLRWGITESEADRNQTLDICLNQVLECDYFIGMLGDRYGNLAPVDHKNDYIYRKNPELAWLGQYDRGASITELEIQTQLNKKLENKYQRSFFYFRDNQSLVGHVSDEHAAHLWDESDENRLKLDQLKRRIKQTGYEIFDGYPCKWLAYDKPNNRVLLSGLEQFARRVYNNLLNAVLSEHGNTAQLRELDLYEHWSQLTEAYTHAVAEAFVGRQRLMKKFEKLLLDAELHQVTSASTESAIKLANQHNSVTDVHLITGEAGSGKTSFLSYFLNSKNTVDSTMRFVHSVGAFPGSENITVFLKRLCVQLTVQFSLGSAADLADIKTCDDYGFLKKKVRQLLETVSSQILRTDKFYVIVDGVDSLVDDLNTVNNSFDWLPSTWSSDQKENMIAKIAFIFTARTASPAKAALQRMANSSAKPGSGGDALLRVSLTEIEHLDLLDKSEFVRQCLGKFGKYLEETPFNNQLKMLTGKRDATLPFYLTLACEEIRINAQFESLSEKLKELPLKINLLLDYIVSKLEDNHGYEFVRAVFTFICSARDGLREQELDDLLHMYFKSEELGLSQQIESAETVFGLDKCTVLGKLVDSKFNRLSKLKFVSFIDSIRQIFLSPSSTKLLILKRNELIENCLRSRYANPGSVSKKSNINTVLAQKLMAIYYWRSLDSGFDKIWVSGNNRALTYLPFYLSKASLLPDLAEILTSFQFMAAKCGQNSEQGASELMNDFDLHSNTQFKNILAGGGDGSLRKRFSPARSIQQTAEVKQTVENPLQSKRFLDYKQFFTTNFHLIQKSVDFIYQQAINQPSSTHTYADLKHVLKTNPSSITTSLFIWLNKRESVNDELTANINPVSISDTESVITSVAISPGSEHVACGTASCDVRMYALATGSLVRTFQGHSGEITALVFSGDNVLCSASRDGKASLWNVHDGYRIKVLNKHNGHAVSGVCSDGHRGKMLVTVGWDCTIRLWSPSDGKELGELRGLTKPINCVVFDPSNENMIATGSWDACIRLFNLVDRTRKAVLRGHTASVRAISYSRNGSQIASAAMDGEVRLWNSRNGLNVATLRNGHALPVTSLCYSPSGQFLVTGSVDRRVKVWTGSVGKMITVVHNEEIGDEKEIEPLTCVSINKSTGDSLAVGTQRGAVKIYHLKSGTLIESFPAVHRASVKRVKYTSDGLYVVSSAEDGTVNVLSLETKRVVSDLGGNTKSVNALSVNKSLVVICGNEDGCVSVYPRFLDQKNAEKYQLKLPAHKLFNHKSPITACEFNALGNEFATASKDATLIVWFYHNEKHAPVERFVINSAHSDWITDLSWSANSHVITCSNDQKLRVWSVADNGAAESRDLSGHTANLNACSSSHGFIASAASDGTLKLWSQEKGHEITTLYGHQRRVNSCDLFVKLFSSNTSIKRDQKQVEHTESDDEEMDADILDLFGGHDLAQETAINKTAEKKSSTNDEIDQSKIEHVYLASVSDDGSLRIWKPVESDALLSLEKHNSDVNSVCLNSSDMLATAGADKTVNLWNMRPFFSKVSSGQHVVSDEKSSKAHLSEITSLAAGKQYVLSGSLNGLLFVWSVSYENDGLTVRGLDCAYDMKAHDRAVSSIAILDETAQGLRFVTCSHDNFVKVWFAQTDKFGNVILDLESIQICRSVVFMDTVVIEKNVHLLTVESADGFRISGRIFKYSGKKLEVTKGGFNITKTTSMVAQVKLVKKTNKLYISLLHDEIFKIDLNKCAKSNASFLQTVPHADLARFSSAERTLQNLVYPNNYSVVDKHFYASVEENPDDGQLIAGDCEGNLFARKPHSVSGLCKVKRIHSDEITELLCFKLRDARSGDLVRRTLSASRDGFIRIWSADAHSQVGQFNNVSGSVTKVIAFGAQDRPASQCYFVYGDQMGNVNLINWHESF